MILILMNADFDKNNESIGFTFRASEDGRVFHITKGKDKAYYVYASDNSIDRSAKKEILKNVIGLFKKSKKKILKIIEKREKIKI